MKKFLVSSEKSFTKLLESFYSDEERDEFFNDFDDFVDVIIYYRMFCNKRFPLYVDDGHELVDLFDLKQLERLMLFIQKNYDILLDLMKNFEYQEVTQKELDHIRKEEFYMEIKEKIWTGKKEKKPKKS
jgi:hypothetical protein